MAIVNLGTVTIGVFESPKAFTSIPFINNRAYAFGAVINRDQITNVWSYLEFTAVIVFPNGNTILADWKKEVTLRNSTQVLLLPFTSLYGASNNAFLQVERIPFTRGGGNSGDAVVQLFYDNASTVRSWLDPIESP